MFRPLPSPAETAGILARKRTRPPRLAPPAAGRSLSATLKTLDARFGHTADGLKARWREVAGSVLARRTEPVRLIRARARAADAAAGATLELRVEGPSAALIQHQASDIIARVNLFLGAGAVTRLRIVQGPLRNAAARDRHAAPPRTRQRGPLDAAAEKTLAEGLADLPDGRLKAALARLGREVMRRDGG